MEQTAAKPAHRNIGGSILPSSDPSILQPIQTRAGEVQVRVLAEQDTHGLFQGDTLLAQHPNGYSCHALAKRMRDMRDAASQADYIVRCGGEVTKAGWIAVGQCTAVAA